jgi:hypothetical protein
MCSENSSLRQATVNWASVAVKARRMDLNPASRVFALRLALVGCPRSVDRRAALLLGESADTGRVVGNPYLIALRPSCPSLAPNR